MRKHYRSEYRLGERVYYYDGIDIKSGIITEVKICHEYNDDHVPEINIYYDLYKDEKDNAPYVGTFKEEALFASKEDFKEYVANL